ncbi:hypothetical protein ABIE67_010208 [Streptomyces sp. V4I8]|uniref:BlaI/MecI/CopY family transcriptional regulator n=1 Tax=Streptomyces sp. V4I8 TaxID=3156469 RepID=UPI003513CBE6
MSDAEPATTELKVQYGARVAADLERNAREQERVAAELMSLQEKLRALRHDHALLVNLKQTLGSEDGVATGPRAESDDSTPSVPRQASAGSASTRRKKSAADAGAAKNNTAAKPPTLVELIRSHLVEQDEPRSAAEITTALAQAHPERDIKPKVVRTTVEGLVAKGRVHRSKQGSSVFYTASRPESVEDSAEEAVSAAAE